VQVRHVEQLHLADHERVAGVSGKATAAACELGHEGRSGDHGRFFQRHGHEHLAAVDEEVDGHAERQAVHADHILDHVIGLLRRQPTRAVDSSQLRRAQVRKIGDGPGTVDTLFVVKTRDA